MHFDPQIVILRHFLNARFLWICCLVHIKYLIFLAQTSYQKIKVKLQKCQTHFENIFFMQIEPHINDLFSCNNTDEEVLGICDQLTGTFPASWISPKFLVLSSPAAWSWWDIVIILCYTCLWSNNAHYLFFLRSWQKIFYRYTLNPETFLSCILYV